MTVPVTHLTTIVGLPRPAADTGGAR